ncbi:hypothetical protein OAO18_07115 [Francisellaceae bacterium]|nr:hypothetical protein [Francisellaceae bacterium]
MKYSQYKKIKYGKRMITQVIRLFLIAPLFMSVNEACAFSVEQTVNANRTTWNRGNLYSSVPVFKDFTFSKKICFDNNTSIFISASGYVIEPHETHCLSSPHQAIIKDIRSLGAKSNNAAVSAFNPFIDKQWTKNIVLTLFNVDRANHDVLLNLNVTFTFLSVKIKEVVGESKWLIVAEGDKAQAVFRLNSTIYPINSEIYQDNKLGELLVLHNRLSSWMTTVLKMPRLNIEYELKNKEAEMWVKINESLENYITDNDLTVRQFTTGDAAKVPVVILNSKVRPEIKFGNYILSINNEQKKLQILETDKYGDRNMKWETRGGDYDSLLLKPDGELELIGLNKCGLKPIEIEDIDIEETFRRLYPNNIHENNPTVMRQMLMMKIRALDPDAAGRALPKTPVTLRLNATDGVMSLWDADGRVVWRSKNSSNTDSDLYFFCGE